jgi:hypothetical protein
MTTTETDETTTERLSRQLVEFLETGTAPEGLFAPDVFLDFTMPRWRVQAQGVDEVVAGRLLSHPDPGRVPRSRLDETATGFVIEVEETWDDAAGEPWYCREMMRVDVTDGAVSELSVYCTGDWDRALVAHHAAEITLLRP